MKKLLVILFLTVCFSGCERDDICSDATPTTPHLIIGFYNFDEQESTKNVVGLRVEALNDNNETIALYQAATSTKTLALPLRTVDNDNDPENGITTKFKLHKAYAYDDNETPDDTSDDIISGNPDIISLKYSTEDVYVSRACGYKTIFNNVELDIEDDDSEWILLTQYQEPLIVADETTTHIQIFHQ